jgi:hypothetical protein
VNADDAPRAFKRLMSFARGTRLRSGLDDGFRGGTGACNGEANGQVPETPTIRPGERMADYLSRVDATLPISGLKRKGGDPLGLKVPRTRKEKKMHRLYDQWREEERKIQERKEHELELVAERELDKENGGGSAAFSFLDEATPRRKGRRRGRDVDDEDPWLEIKRRRAEATVGLHDVAKAPPELHKGDSAKRLDVHSRSLKVGNLSKSALSLKKRERLNYFRTRKHPNREKLA